MEMSTSFALLVLLASLYCNEVVLATLPELECPEECDCHYFRINWVTDCSENNLTEVPKVGLSQNVYILNMNDNDLTELSPFPADIKLRRLQLADNALTRVSRESFAGLNYLLDVDLSGNQIATVDPDAFRDSPGLLTLELQENPLEPVNGTFLISLSLKYLDLSNCGIQKMSVKFFTNITTLAKLDLSKNPLSSIDSGVFDPLSSLEELKLSNCNISNINDRAFFNLTSLKMLDLSNNFLTSVHWSTVLGPLVRLEYLNLRHSQLLNLPEDAFDKNDWLRTLVLAENELHDLDIATTLGHNLRHLDTLDLTDCRLKGPLSEDAFANATSLKTLSLSGNSLSAADLSVALAPLVRLHKLSLRGCGMNRLPPNTFHRFTALEELDISHNPLNDAFTGILSPLETLQYLDMGHSNLSHISRGTFSKMNHLRRLVLSGNSLTDLESGLFQNLTQLRILELNNCGLRSPPDEALFGSSTYESFEELHLSGNPLKVSSNYGSLFPRQLASTMTKVDLSNCGLSVLPPNAFDNTPQLSVLILSGNRFKKETDLECLSKISHLERLDLSFCNLTNISPGVFSQNPSLKSLNLVGNPWQCSCAVVDLWRWARSTPNSLGLLEGAIINAEDIATGAGKRKKGLICHYTPRITRTWARYVRESGSKCPLVTPQNVATPQRYMAPSVKDVVRRAYEAIDESPPVWIMVVTVLSLVVFIGTVVITGGALLRRHFRKSSSRDHSEASTVSDAETPKDTYPDPLQRRRTQKLR